jgi:hypothetical protein
MNFLKDPILACTHKNLEKCHYTYVTHFKSAQEEVCTNTINNVNALFDTFKKRETMDS